MTYSRTDLEQYRELLGILGRFTQHKMNMDDSIQVSCIIDKLPPSCKDFKHTLKHKKEELTLVELGSHLRIDESLRVQDSIKSKGNNVVGPSVVNMVEYNNFSRYNDNKGKRKHHDNTRANPNKKAKPTCWKYGKTGHIKRDCKGVNVGNKANGLGTKGSVDDRCWFKTYESLKDGSILHMGNESTALVHGCGCVDLKLNIVNDNIGSVFMSTSKLNDLIIWHARLGHVHFKRMQDMSKDGLIPAFDMDTEKFVRLPDLKLKTLGKRGIECIFVGYAEHSKAFRFYSIEPNESVSINSIIESWDAVFDENRFSSVPRLSQRYLINGTKDFGGSVVSHPVMAAQVISISSDVSVESVRSSFLRVILIDSTSVEVPVAPEVGAAVVASPVGVLELDTHSSSEVDPSESSPPLVSVAPMVSPFLCLNDSESDTEIPKRHVSPTTSTLEVPTGPILPAPSIVVAPSSEALTARKSVRPLHSHRLALRYTSNHLDHFTSGSSLSHSSSDHSSSGHSISGHSLPGHLPVDTTVADSSTPLVFFHPPLARTPRCSEAYLRWRSTPLSTMSPAATVTSSIHATKALVPSRADLLPPRKRFRDSVSPEDSVEEDIDTDVLGDIEANATTDEVAVDRDVKAGVNAGIGMEVDVGVDVEDEVEDEVESSDRGTMEVGVDVVAGIDIPYGMLMPDAMERLEQVEEGLQDIYDHGIEIPLQRIEDIETGQRELEARSLIDGGERASLLDQVASLERSNARLRGTMMMKRARADRFWRRMSFMENGLRQIRRFRYYDRMQFRRLETSAARRLGFRP
ncbi:reverse transcriptase domain-containing protein [Tanacetum coccineum]